MFYNHDMQSFIVDQDILYTLSHWIHPNLGNLVEKLLSSRITPLAGSSSGTKLHVLLSPIAVLFLPVHAALPWLL